MTSRLRYWLSAALVAAFLLHITRLPLWLDLVLLLVLFWRIPAVEQRLPLPNTPVKALLVVAGLAGIRSTYHTVFGPEAGVAFLIVCAALKFLETKNQRDYYVMAILAFFIVATIFLFEKGAMTTAYTVFASWVIASALLAANWPQKISLILRKSAVLVGQAIPLMVILFVFFPRLPPLWTLHLTQSNGRTGMSDTMSPGDLAALGQSTELAFRVEFPQNKFPPKASLYWRGLVLTRFDGRAWHVSDNPRLSDDSPLVAWSNQPLPPWTQHDVRIKETKPHKYKVIMEPTDQLWLYALNIPYSSTKDVGLARDLHLVSRFPIFQQFTYDALQFEREIVDPDLPYWLRQENLQLPQEGNPTARKMAQQWRQYYGSDEAYVQAILRWFRKNQFFYTLQPPPLGDNRVDEFLFQTKKGFCEHYASATTFLLRAAGIPARVVTGYQGGEASPTGDSWQVRQMDAHAWIEAWLPEKGWIQIDPTAAVAPDRIEHGMGTVAQQSQVWGGSATGAVRYANYKLFGQLRNMLDYWNYRWQKDVVGYDQDQQESFLVKLLGDSSLWKKVFLMMAGSLVIVSLLSFWFWWRARPVIHPSDKSIVQLSQRLRKHQLQRATGEGVVAYLERLAQEQPAWQMDCQQLSQLYVQCRYQSQVDDQKLLQSKMAQIVRKWRFVGRKSERLS